MSLDFEKYAQKGNEFLNYLMRELRTEDRDKASRILRAVLRALRNRLTTEESMQLIAQLPMALKATYVDGWKLTRAFERIKHLDELVYEVLLEDRNTASFDFQNEEGVKYAIGAVFRTLVRYISEGELEDILALMPREIKEFLKNSMATFPPENSSQVQ